jgi:cytochrome b pre-mRNA-processing protein 3
MQHEKAAHTPGRRDVFQRLFRRDSNRKVVDALYAAIVAAARRPRYFADWQVPDTPLGRFEMISLHMFLLQHRLRGETGAARDVAQSLTDDFFTDVDHSLRELGIGDTGVPKRMKKLARMYYGRTVSYGDAIDNNDRDALAAALARNIRPDAAEWPHGPDLADHVMDSVGLLRAMPTQAILEGRLDFAEPA